MQADSSESSSSASSSSSSASSSSTSTLHTATNQQQQPTQTTADQALDLLVEANRLATFKNWPNPNISPESLAKAGFFYLNRLDEVKCVWCKGVIAKWEKQDNAFDEHKRFFPQCPRVQLGPLIEMTSDGIRDLGIQQMTPPTKPKFSSIDARLRTYANWPITDIQRPDALAQAGLYYQNIDDQVRCFHCNIGLRSWQKEDDPWFEHAKWYPQCQFVRLVKGPNYVQNVQDLSRQHSAAAGQQELPTPGMTLEDAMSTAPVRQALEIGLDGGSIRNATQRQLLSTGYPYSNVEDLLKAIFDDRVDEESSNHDDDDNNLGGDEAGRSGSSGSSSAILREVSRFMQTFFDVPTTNIGNSTDDLPSTSVSTASTTSSTVNLVTPSSPPPPPPLNESHHAAIDPNATTENASGNENTIVATSNTKRPTSLLVPVPLREPSPKRSLSLEEENRKLKDARLCKVCLDEEVGVVFLPCGHLVTCVQCAQGVSQCPMCRTDIKGFVRTYLS